MSYFYSVFALNYRLLFSKSGCGLSFLLVERKKILQSCFFFAYELEVNHHDCYIAPEYLQQVKKKCAESQEHEAPAEIVAHPR